MNSRIKLAGLALMIGSLAACADQPPQHFGGSQPVYGGGNANNNGYGQPVNNGGYNNNGYNNGQNGNVQNNVAYGTVERIDSVGGRKDTGLGAVIGAGVGAIAGNQIGRSMNDAKTTGTVAGAIGGGLLGNAIERNQNQNAQVNRVYVRLDDGSERYWDVGVNQLNVSVGTRVRIQNDTLYSN